MQFPVNRIQENLETLSLTDVPAGQVHHAQQAAAVRLLLYVTGQIHQEINEVLEAGRTAIFRTNQIRGRRIEAPVAMVAQTAMLRRWTLFIDWYTDLMARSIITAAQIPMGTWAVMHHDQLGNFQFEESVKRPLTEALNPDAIFNPVLDVVIDAANSRTYSDDLVLSQRIWQLDQYGRNGINQAISNAMVNGPDAWELAGDVEQFLGPGRDCPRWTRDRLRDLTKRDIASGDRTGLWTGDECRGQGVAYNALRLARTEIMYALNDATTRIFKTMPWIELEKINLSPAHAVPDICDNVVAGGQDGNGEYPVGEVTLPLHPHCMCFKTAVLMKSADFAKKMRRWLNGTGAWLAMDQYQSMLGGSVQGVDLRSGVAMSMAYWLWGGHDALGALFWSMALRSGR